MKFRLVNSGDRLGIYKIGGGWIIDPSTTLFFNDEVEAIYARIIQ